MVTIMETVNHPPEDGQAQGSDGRSSRGPKETTISQAEFDEFRSWKQAKARQEAEENGKQKEDTPAAWEQYLHERNAAAPGGGRENGPGPRRQHRGFNLNHPPEYYEPYVPPTPTSWNSDSYGYTNDSQAFRPEHGYYPESPAFRPPVHPQHWGQPLVENTTLFGATAFASHIVHSPPQPDFRFPTIRDYNGKEDPREHIARYKYAMMVRGPDEATLCKGFPSTLVGAAMTWMLNLPPGSIGSFAQLEESFLMHFGSSKKRTVTMQQAGEIRQGQNESLEDYVKRFTAQIVQVCDYKEDVAQYAFLNGLQKGKFKSYLYGKKQITFQEMLRKADTQIQIQNFEKEEENHLGNSKKDSRKKESKRQSGPGEERHPDNGNYHAPGLQATGWDNANRFQAQSMMTRPEEARAEQEQRRPGKWCIYHQATSHDTRECRGKRPESNQSREQSVHLASRKAQGYRGRQNPYPPRYVNPQNQLPPKPRQPQPNPAPRVQNFPRPDGHVGTISGRHEPPKPSRREQRRMNNAPVPRGHPVMSIEKPAPKPYQIDFNNKETCGWAMVAADPLVIHVQLGTKMVKRVMVDTGSSADILYWDAYQKMNLDQNLLRPTDCTLVGFAGERVKALGVITLDMILGDEPGPRKSEKIDFLVIPTTSSYNALLGRVSLCKFEAVTSIAHFCLKFPTLAGIGVAKGNIEESRTCYVSSEKGERKPMLANQLFLPGVLGITEEAELDPRMPAKSLNPAEAHFAEVEKQSITPFQNPEEKLYIGGQLKAEVVEGIKHLLSGSRDVFAWTPKDLKGIPPSLMTHSLSINPEVKPRRQKRRKQAGQKNEAAAAELAKLLKADFVRTVQYPVWLANVVMVPKKEPGKWRMCVDFTDLNKACPKDSYPLPAIDQLVDSTAGHEALSFLDAYSGYNQVMMNPADSEHTAFITDKGTFCYRVMPFGLKNAGATFQRLVDLIFRNQIGTTVEAYVDDIVVKSKKQEDHVNDLQEVFETLRRYGMSLNPEKCVFGVTEGKFLGFQISSRGVEVNPDKVKAVLDMTPPRTTHEVQRFVGRVNYLGRFCAKLAEKNLPFFEILRKPKDFAVDRKMPRSIRSIERTPRTATHPDLSRPGRNVAALPLGKLKSRKRRTGPGTAVTCVFCK